MNQSRKKYTTESYIRALKETNPNDLDYSEVEYIKKSIKVTVSCNVCAYKFKTNPQDLLHKKTGCPKCRLMNFSKFGSLKKKSWEEVLQKIKNVHGEKYTYVEDSYQSVSKPMDIICKEHGKFTQLLHNHINGQGCPKCGLNRRNKSTKERITPLDLIIETSKKIHNNKYKYLEETYLGRGHKMGVICNLHGLFYQNVNDHLEGHGCVKCGNSISKPQLEIANYIRSLGLNIIENYKLKNGKHLDIVCPVKKIAFEYNGLIWHSEKFNKDKGYHLDKTIQAKSEGFRLIHIFEDEWLMYKDKVKNIIDVVLGKTSIKYDARKSFLDTEISWKEAKTFMDLIHIQGACVPCIKLIGLRLITSGELVCLMVFDDRPGNGTLEIIRFCSKGIVRGGFSKLLKIGIDIYKPTSIISFSDNRLNEGDIYKKTGFEHIGDIEPRYWYIKGQQRFHRRGFQKQYLKKMFHNYDDSLTELENCKRNGYYRIWDCGKKKWELKLNK